MLLARRFALQYEIGLPNQAERVAILRRYLLRHEADMAVLRQGGALGEQEGGVELDLLLNRWAAGRTGSQAAAARARVQLSHGIVQGQSHARLCVYPCELATTQC